MQPARRGERDPGGGFADHPGQAPGVQPLLHRSQCPGAGQETDHPARRQTGAGERRGMKVGPFLRPQKRSGAAGEDAGDEARRGSTVFGLGAKARDFVKYGLQAIARQATIDSGDSERDRRPEVFR